MGGIPCTGKHEDMPPSRSLLPPDLAPSDCGKHASQGRAHALVTVCTKLKERGETKPLLLPAHGMPCPSTAAGTTDKAELARLLKVFTKEREESKARVLALSGACRGEPGRQR